MDINLGLLSFIIHLYKLSEVLKSVVKNTDMVMRLNSVGNDSV